MLKHECSRITCRFIGDDIFAANTKAAGFFASQRWLLVFNYE